MADDVDGNAVHISQVCERAVTIDRETWSEFIYSLKSFCAFSIIQAMMTCNGDGHRIE